MGTVGARDILAVGSKNRESMETTIGGALGSGNRRGAERTNDRESPKASLDSYLNGSGAIESVAILAVLSFFKIRLYIGSTMDGISGSALFEM